MIPASPLLAFRPKRPGLSKLLHRCVVSLSAASAFVLVCASTAFADQFPLVTPQSKIAIVYDAAECKLDSISANLLADDIQRVSGYRPVVSPDLSTVKGDAIIIGSINSKQVSALKQPAMVPALKGKWESYAFRLLNHPTPNINKALVIAGSDYRGTAYGVFEISARIGVTPWYWWADATPTVKKELYVDINNEVSAEPSIKFRGIFINDEDWGLQPWAAKTFEPETKDIGPKTYAKVFELLLRLKANLIWPAMHPSTKPFYHYPDNIKVAKDYQIVIGSSHAEPMLRNNVGEWNEKTMGAFNYLTNKDKVYDYWESRVKESKGVDAIYTVGMRGVHDSGIEGVKTPKEAVPLLQRIFDDQRALFKKYINPDATKVPQAFTAYKEVLDVYDAGLKVPDDVTLIWPDDNYGYIQRLNNEQENKRSGGSGVYYHVSYWGRPHDYIWLSSTSPGLIREEMSRAYEMNARNVWVVNVGDIKPAEYDIQYFLDMAYNVKPFLNTQFVKPHLKAWVADNLGAEHADEITDVMWKYYQLAFERRPEFMGWSQTEPTTPVHPTAYNHFSFGDQAQRRMDAFEALEKEVKTLQASIPTQKKDCFFQTVYYPVVCASEMSKKFLYTDKALLYGKQGRISAAYYDTLARGAYNTIAAETDFYNKQMSNGKWRNMMSMGPRSLPVYAPPGANHPIAKRTDVIGVSTEGGAVDSLAHNYSLSLPGFDGIDGQSHFMDVFLTRAENVHFSLKTSVPWIKSSVTAGDLDPSALKSQQRIWITVDQAKLQPGLNSGVITLQAGAIKYTINVSANNAGAPKGFTGFVAADGYVSMNAKHFQDVGNDALHYWSSVAGLGATDQSVEALPLNAKTRLTDDGSAVIKNPSLSYRFYTRSAAPAAINIVTLPTFALNSNYGVRYGVSIDGGPVSTLNFKTFGRSEEWKQAVLSNSITRTIKLPQLGAGVHTLKIFMIDPGVILDRIVVNLGGADAYYGLLPESKMIK
ncbi:glycosyl hydrolase family 115 (putative glucuronidase) [Mucilaginibacter yixingensis]|uniref:Glycosyl hydrolase family 115 (Putative glucuronidase) n=1 Tax=Mucilaginibacter yixingensis TaxID=1295612 RepID=A0A2T5JBF8_9SPHI|nr:glycosyl hydrolase family 115 (putative glucuronidase) [Mucilaginibacter yixingensis]